MRAEILNQEDDILTIKLHDELADEDKERFTLNGRLFALLELYDPESITADQRKHIFALFGDMFEYTGYPRDYWERFIKENFMHHEFLMELPSLAGNKMSKAMAGKFIEYIIIYCIQHEIPFRKDQFYLPRESSKYIYWATITRHCVICGKPHASIHHVDTVGAGRNRNKIDHTQNRVMALCPIHHSETHDIGVDEFEKKYLVKGIKLKQKDLKQLGVS